MDNEELINKFNDVATEYLQLAIELEVRCKDKRLNPDEQERIRSIVLNLGSRAIDNNNIDKNTWDAGAMAITDALFDENR